MEVTGFKPGTAPAPATGPGGPKLAVGERLSMCGKFAINGSGQWRELPRGDQVSRPHEFQGVAPDGKPLAPTQS